ncbi:OCIA domain-containing protein 1 [Ixodes scapularis]|uniref:OCIA domain-containing protein 1 n=1 Tax=Ixodes scapularis TaxID=6945 RepID=UPI001A9D1946|nr:OCIA domain-containing protein 1 [Ixodes scapularis]
MAASSDIIPPEISASGYEHQQRPQGQRYAFTPEELRVLKECNRESFYYRSLPFATAAMVAVHYGAKAGYLTAHPRFGTTLKVVGAGFAGWLIGKFSYQSTCEQKLMQLPGSVIGDAIRRKRGLSSSQTTGDPQDSNQVLDFTLKDPQYSSRIAESSSRPSSLDTLGHTTYQGLDDSFRPSMDNPNATQAPEDLPPPQYKTSYDELRRQNRLEHERRLAVASSAQHQQQAAQLQPELSDPASQANRPSQLGARDRPPRSAFDTRTAATTIPGTVPARSTGAKKNDYGDTWDD